MTRLSGFLALALLAGACKDEPSKLDKLIQPMPKTAAPGMSGVRSDTSGCNENSAAVDIDSKDILARTKLSTDVYVKHVLIGWKDAGPRVDPRAKERTQAQAATMAQDFLAQLKADPSKIDSLVAQNSEDPGSKGGDPYEVKTDSRFVPEFKDLALRLEPNEAGIVKTQFGYHVMERVSAPPPDPMESADILARTDVEKDTAVVKHVLVKYAGAPGAGDEKRTKAEAEARVKEILGKLQGGAKIEDLMKEYSDDPGSKTSGKEYEVKPASQMVEPFKNLSLRLKLDEVGVVKSPFGYHIIKRIAPPPPPPPDPIETADILARTPVTEKADVKHILLGWTDVHAQDPRGVKRTRAELETLVKATVAKLKGGAKIEPLMKELSEDPGSAASGESYPVTPDAGLVEPFKKLSLRLKPGEVGVVKTDFGIHIIQRVDGMAGGAAPAPTTPPTPPPAPKAPAKAPAAAPAVTPAPEKTP
ncbi:MAG TPA: peptidylprolyl isomerase [Kofleriaceae bacterium]|jgi:parvulin-like peptidyl-prolyl isomerase